MTTYNNILDFLKENRERVIESYNRTSKGISLKDYMNEVINFFNDHRGKANKVLKGTSNDYLGEAIKVANDKANARAWRARRKAAIEEHVKQMNCRGWYQKNFH